MRVLVVWEPILPTDWAAPSSNALARLPDERVKQFYDPNHVISGKLKEFAAKHPPQPEPSCCVRKGFYWDEAILYPPHSIWKDQPNSAFWDGPVFHVISALEGRIDEHH